MPKTSANFLLQVIPEEKVEFGLDTHQAPVGVELTDTITLSNSRKTPTVWLTKTELSISLTVLCTTVLETNIIIQASKDLENLHTFLALNVNLSSKLSTHLDQEELMLDTAIGEGAFGIVYKATWRGQPVAVKIIKSQEGKKVITEFEQEVRILESIRCPQIVSFIGAVRTPGKLALVTELFPYGSLKSAINKHPFSYQLILKCFLDCTRGMTFLHQANVLHRDLKPDNLLVLTLDIGAPVNCKITDFGTSRNFTQTEETQNFTTGVGTPMYMPPELLASGKYRESADVYSFGILAWEIVTRRDPFSDLQSFWKITEFVINGNRPPLEEINSPGLKSIIEKCWAQDHHDRPRFEDVSPLLEQELALQELVN
ncbi:protein serine/threonine kinase [Pelomyxa schiedti]|nr:protein serine/threonine kinase [Pelomyxa schiedti]